MDRIAEIRKLYFSATKATIGRDLDRAIDLLKEIPTEEERSRAAVFMEGLAAMRKEWGGTGTKNSERRTKNKNPRA
jgi:hypothetical protein